MLLAEYKHYVQADLSLVAQMSKITWLQEMDRNTSYFHAKIKEKKKRRKILSIKAADGSVLSDLNQIQNEFVQFYVTLFGSMEEQITPLDEEVVRRGRILTDEESISMCRSFTEADVKEVVFQIPNDKTLGPDDFSSYFYKAAWGIIGDDLTKEVLNFFQSGKILTQINATNIVLVPKASCPQTVADYRPISCCNVIYKVIFKLLTKRLNEVLHMLIDESQAAFVSGRSIITNVLLCQDRCLMKIDIRKAYDMVHWKFLLDVLNAMNFPTQFVRWIEICLSTARFSILIDGVPCGYFPGKRSLRQ